MKYERPNLFYYRIAQVVSWFAATFVFKRKILRNEIKGKKGAFVVIANHEAALDFVNLIGATCRPMHFVISKFFYSTLPIQGFLKKIRVIPKQQFQTTTNDLKQMKRVVEAGQPVVIYPAGLMCEDGLSTPIPGATYKFLKWLGVDVYVARTRGAYFVMPKWSKKLRPGKTCIDIYRLFTKEELAQMDLNQVQEKTENALLYDAYREQEQLQISYQNGRNIRGLEYVLYQCPNCGEEFMMTTVCDDEICCSGCGFSLRSDNFGFMHNEKGIGEEIRYVSDWSRWIYNRLKEQIRVGEVQSISCNTQICMVDDKRHKFVPEGQGKLTLQRGKFLLQGTIGDALLDKEISVLGVPTLPFSPGKYLEIQDGGTIYRCILEDGKLVMKFINILKIFYEQSKIQEKVSC